MSYSVRFYIKINVSADVMGGITKAAQNLGKFVEYGRYYEFKTDHHLLTHTEEFIPFEFQQKVRPLTTKVTLVTENYGRFGMNSSDTRRPTWVGTSLVSYEQNKVMIIGKSLKLIIQAYLLFCKYNGEIPDYKNLPIVQKEDEYREKYNHALSKIRQLEEQLNAVSKPVVKRKWWQIV